MLNDLCAGLNLRECYSCARFVGNHQLQGRKHYGWIKPQLHNGKCMDYVQRLQPPPQSVEDKL